MDGRQSNQLGMQAIPLWLSDEQIDNVAFGARNGLPGGFILRKIEVTFWKDLAVQLVVSDLAGKSLSRLFDEIERCSSEIKLLNCRDTYGRLFADKCNGNPPDKAGIPDPPFVFDV